LQIADSRWLTSLAETVNVIGKKLGPGGVSIYNMYIYIYTYTYIEREIEMNIPLVSTTPGAPRLPKSMSHWTCSSTRAERSDLLGQWLYTVPTADQRLHMKQRNTAREKKCILLEIYQCIQCIWNCSLIFN
jgi:hypothetical protein